MTTIRILLRWRDPGTGEVRGRWYFLAAALCHVAALMVVATAKP